MKTVTTTILLLFLVTSISLGQVTTLTGYLDLNFGSSIASAKAYMLKRPGVTFDAGNSKAEKLIFDGGTWAGKQVSFTVLGFTTEGLHTIAVYLDQGLESQVIERFRDYKALMVEKYGSPANDFFFFKSPYEEGDGHETLALKVGKCTAAAYWHFPSGEVGADNSLSIEIDTSLSIIVTYQSGPLIRKAIERQKSRNKNDM